MRAATLTADGKVELAELEPPRPGPGSTLVAVAAAGLNPIDLITAAATAAAHPGAVAGREGVGTVDGRRFYFGAAVPPHGAAAELTVVLDERLVELPEGVEDGVAIALGVAGQAAWLGLEWRAALRPGEHVLVLGASGAVGEIGVQAARLLGAGRVVAAARSEAGLRRASELGADAVVRLGERPREELAAELLGAAEGRIDVVLDPLWGEPGLAALAAVSAGGRHVQLGGAAGREMPFNPGPLRGRAVAIQPFSSAAVPLQERLAAYRRTLELAARGELTARVRELPLAEAQRAWELQARSPGAKLLLRIQ